MFNILKDNILSSGKTSEQLIKFTNSFTYTTDTFSDDEQIIKLLAKSRFSFTSNEHFDFAEIPYYILIYIVTGNISIGCNEHLYSIEKGSITIISPDTALKFRSPSSSAIGYFFILTGKQINYYLNKLKIKEIYIQKSNPYSDIGELSEKIYNHSETDTKLTMLYYSNRLNDIFYELCRLALADTENNTNEHNTDKHIPNYIKEIKKLFDNEYYKDYSLDFLEETFGKNKYRISREFTSAYNVSPFKYLNSVRINEAKKLLLNSELNIRETGYEVGIKNTNHFISLFKKETGTTPLSFRKDAPALLKNWNFRI